jgi:DinB family protein
MTILANKNDLMDALKDAHQRVEDWFIKIPVEDFFARLGDVWSSSDNVDHLIKSTKPIAKAMRLPKVALQGMFGKAENSSRPYEEICQIYRAEIAKGAQASGRYLPNQENPTEQAEAKKKELLDQWAKVSKELIAIADEWDENELDQYQLPHPILGKLTIREMLFFTIHHNLRHASQEGD